MSYFPLADFEARAREVRSSLSGDTALRIYDRTIAAIDPKKVRGLQEKYRDELADFDPIGVFKYADLPFWIARNVALSQRLALDQGPAMALLDIGMGAGHFAAVAQALGHTVVGTDIPVPLYDDIAAALELDRRIAPIVRAEPHPDVGGPFDRIVIVWQVFDYIRTLEGDRREYWPLSDWEFLLRDLGSNHAQPDGIIHLELNPHIQGSDSYFDQDLLDFCADHGADMQLRDLGIADLPVSGLIRS